MAFSLLYSDVDHIGLFSYVDALAEQLAYRANPEASYDLAI